MIAFVTGATGLLGNALVRQLSAAGQGIRALSRSPEKAARVLGGVPNVEIVAGDVTQIGAWAGALDGCDVLFHAAAYFREFYQPGDHRSALQAVNVTATENVLRAAAKRGVKKAVYVSTVGTIGETGDGSLAGETGDGSLADETTPPGKLAAANGYFASKVRAEAVVQTVRRETGLPVTLILPGWMFGPADSAPTGSGQLVLDFLAGRLPGILGGGGCVVDARDVAAALVRAACHGEDGARYIVAGRFLRFFEILQTLGSVSCRPAPRRKIPYAVSLAYAALVETQGRLTRRSVLITRDAVRSLHDASPVSSAKACRELGVSFRPFDETLRDEIAWFAERGVPPPPRLRHPSPASQERGQ